MVRTIPHRVLISAAAALAVLATGCSSSTSKSADTAGSTSSTSSTSSTTSTTVAESTTSAAATTAVATTAPPTTSAPATNPPATNPPATNPPATAPSGPQILSFSVNGPTCPAVDVSFSVPSQPVRVSWTASDADSVYIAIDNPDGPFVTGLPLSGSYDLPDPCPGPFSHTYYVVAVKGAQKAVKSKTLTG